LTKEKTWNILKNILNIKINTEVFKMGDISNRLNYFLVKIFNEILKTEEYCLTANSFKELSMREIHIIEAVCNAQDNDMDNRATAIAASQGITAGTLTTAVTQLIKKGYLFRKRDSIDKRIVRIYPTEKAKAVNIIHSNFHCKMVEDIEKSLTNEQLEALVKGLITLESFFEKYNEKRK
jgi:DNA-binding MarR family transcriptional regulator